MNDSERNELAEIELIKDLEPSVKIALKYLVGDKKKWWASQFFNFMEMGDEECFERLKKLRQEAGELKDEELVVLVGNEVTEEALPNYSRRLTSLYPDQTGVSQNAWSIWGRGWDSEEKMHGRVLDRYLLLTGRVNQKAVDDSVDSLIRNGMSNTPGLVRGILYPAFQEPAMALSHMNMARLARQRGVETLYQICSSIAKDETRHAAFYREMVIEMINRDPERIIIEWRNLMRDKVVMPAANMTDGVYTEPPTLFEHFAGVANRIGVYTSSDYSGIVRKLNNEFGIANVSVSGEAAKAQEYLLDLPNRLDKFAERVKNRIASPVGFDWIYGRKA